MKKKILLLMGVFSLGLLQAQVGVNTITPIAGSVLHIDAAGNNTSTSPTLQEATDDIIIDSEGNVGLGVIAPTAKLHISTNYTGGGVPALKYVNGEQGEGKFLQSDANGNATWATPPRTDGAIYNMMKGNKMQFPTGSQVLLTSIEIEETGFYVAILRWWGTTTTVRATTTKQTSGRIYLCTSSNTANNFTADTPGILDEYDHYETLYSAKDFSGVADPDTYSNAMTNRLTFAHPFYGTFTKGQYLKFYVHVRVGGPWWIATPASARNNRMLNPSIILYRQ